MEPTGAMGGVNQTENPILSAVPGMYQLVHRKAIQLVHRKAIQLEEGTVTAKDMDPLTDHPRAFLIQMGKVPARVIVWDKATVLLPEWVLQKEVLMEKARATHPARMWDSPILYQSARIRVPAFRPQCRSR